MVSTSPNGRRGTAAPAGNPGRATRLVIEMDRVALAIYMWVNLEEAALDMPHGPVSELFERFIRWTR